MTMTMRRSLLWKLNPSQSLSPWPQPHHQPRSEEDAPLAEPTSLNRPSVSYLPQLHGLASCPSSVGTRRVLVFLGRWELSHKNKLRSCQEPNSQEAISEFLWRNIWESLLCFNKRKSRVEGYLHSTRWELLMWEVLQNNQSHRHLAELIWSWM